MGSRWSRGGLPPPDLGVESRRRRRRECAGGLSTAGCRLCGCPGRSVPSPPTCQGRSTRSCLPSSAATTASANRRPAARGYGALVKMTGVPARASPWRWPLQKTGCVALVQHGHAGRSRTSTVCKDPTAGCPGGMGAPVDWSASRTILPRTSPAGTGSSPAGRTQENRREQRRPHPRWEALKFWHPCPSGLGRRPRAGGGPRVVSSGRRGGRRTARGVVAAQRLRGTEAVWPHRRARGSVAAGVPAGVAARDGPAPARGPDATRSGAGEGGGVPSGRANATASR